MNNSKVRDIKKGQKESFLLKEISKLILKISLDDNRLSGLIINRVKLSSDKSLCYVYIYTINGLDEFKEKLDILKLYKPSLRQSVAKALKSRYVPDIKFEFDEQFEKQEKIDKLFETLKKEGQL